LIDFNSRIPFYLQLKELLLKDIEGGVYKSGDKIPTEFELCDAYQISRPTVRQAVDELVREGYLVRKRRLGTFVSPRVFTKAATIFRTFAEEISEKGLPHSAKLIKKEIVKASEELAKILKVNPGDPLFHIVRLRLADNEPLVIRDSIIPCYLDEDLFDQDLEELILYEHFGKKGYYPYRSKQTFQAVKASKEEAGLLEIQENDPLLSWDGIVFLEGDIPLEKVQVLYVGSRFCFEIDQTVKTTNMRIAENEKG